jgi:hypothetical protein
MTQKAADAGTPIHSKAPAWSQGSASRSGGGIGIGSSGPRAFRRLA